MSLDKRPLNFILPAGMAFTLVGLVLLAFANSYVLILLSVAVVGVGSAVFHPEASRVARAASGGRHGFAQSLFQVGGNFGQSLGPLLAAFIVVPFGQHSVLIFTALALGGGGHSDRRQPLVRRGSRPAAQGGRGDGRRPIRAAVVRAHALRADRDAVLEGPLPLEPQQLLHVLSDPDFRRVDSELAGAAVRVPRLRRRGHVPRRAAGRPVRREIRDLGLDPRRPALHPAACRISGSSAR